MVPTSALRETVVLVLFGIVLVPIAAKRAQDAPGYWQTFSTRAEQSLAYDGAPPQSSSSSSSSGFALVVNESLTYGTPTAEEVAKSNVTIPMYASWAIREKTGASMMVRVRTAKVEEQIDSATATTTQSSDMAAAATVTPGVMSTDKGSTGTSTVAKASTHTEASTDPKAPIAKASAASKERWMLIWMGVAITVVALFMSCC